jgi:hypothetical protein
VREIVINGRARRCRPLPNDPLDKVDVRPRLGERPYQGAIVPLGDGKYAFGPSREIVTGPDFWQRTGTGIDQYVFRSPTDGSPMCIGANFPDPHTWGQLVRIVDAAPYHGKRVRFTLWVATGGAQLVRFWLAAGERMKVLHNGGNTDNHPWGGDHGWTPVMLEIGPVAERADHISYGFLLYGGGSVWAYRPKLEIVGDETPRRSGDVLVIGSDRSTEDRSGAGVRSDD